MRFRKTTFLLLVTLLAVGVAPLLSRSHGAGAAAAEDSKAPYPGYTGSSSCRECHERFYKLWAPSYHGLAMQPYTDELARKELTPQEDALTIGKYGYHADVNAGAGYVIEKGPEGEKKYPIVHVLGGKNVYYFLTPTERGRLQTLPVAYDVRQHQWFDTAASGVRHFPGTSADEPVHWTDSLYTFNTSCHGCHVSQLSTNYDLKSDIYHTEWVEPGINCETCHGGGAEHVRVCQAAPEGKTPKDLKIISTKPFTHEQTNSMCASCHAKLNPVSAAYKPGDRYFDHYDLITLEHPDFYPDGRDLGENYTYTTWRMSPCVKAGELDCKHCHTSSGRYRFKESAKANNACLPCHEEHVKNPAAHTQHTDESGANECVKCHMPMTNFARMRRSDHSMRPPMPAATVKFKSPNACNICHIDEDAAWSDTWVRKWRKRDYQKATLKVAGLVDTARRQDWSHLSDMLAYVERKDRDEVFATSLIRLVRSCDSDRKWPVVIKALNGDSSPLVRAAAAEVLDGYLTAESLKALLKAAGDEYRLVRVRAAASLAAVRPQMVAERYRKDLLKATAEFEAAMSARPDDNVSHYNLGNFYADRREYKRAVDSFRTAIRLRPDFMPPYVNIAFAYNALGQNDKAEQSFRKALVLEPNSVVTYLNLGMLLGEHGRVSEAEKTLRKALQVDPNSAVAAYNLGVILAADRPKESVEWCRKAYELRPEEPKYGYTYAFYLNQTGSQGQAIKVLSGMVGRQVAHADVYAFLAAIHTRRGDFDKAREVYEAAAKSKELSQSERDAFNDMARRLR
ncbi:MAG: tetratricopeptide repeat protein [Planctomycetota bacterium]|jgi:tetratricopeptide (TPR) repeat protein